jgi:hypothetical protein
MSTDKDRTSKRLQKLLKERKGMVPVWVRAPSIGPEFFSGFTRAKLYQLSAAGLIESRSIKEPGKERGCRLFNLRSILEYIESTTDETATVTAEAA